MGPWISTPDGVRLAVRRFEPDEAGDTAVVLVHGFGATKDDPTVVAVAEDLRAAGHRVVTYTARGHGESEGLCTLGDLEHHDVAAAVDLAHADADRVVLVGTSMGAIAVLRHAATAPSTSARAPGDTPTHRHATGPADRAAPTSAAGHGSPIPHTGSDERAVVGVVTVSSPAEWRVPRTFQSAAAAALTQLPPGRWAARRFLGVRLARGWSDASPPVELAAALDAPLAVVHGTGDRFIRPTEAAKLHHAAGGPRRLDLVDSMGHAFMPESVPVIRRAVRWVLDAADPAAASAGANPGEIGPGRPRRSPAR